MRNDKEMTDIMTLQISIIILTLSCMGNGITDYRGGCISRTSCRIEWNLGTNHRKSGFVWSDLNSTHSLSAKTVFFSRLKWVVGVKNAILLKKIIFNMFINSLKGKFSMCHTELIHSKCASLKDFLRLKWTSL